MQAVFLTVAGTGLLYFLAAKRQFDFFSTAFISALVYFLPGFFGYVNDFTYEGEATKIVHVPLIPETYLVFVIVLAAILLAGVTWDHAARSKKLEIALQGGENATAWAVVLSLVGFAIFIATGGYNVILSCGRIFPTGSSSQWYYVWTTGASLGVVLSFMRGRRVLFLLSLVQLLVAVYTGDRASLAMCAIALFTLWLSRMGRQRLLRNWKAALGGAVAAAFFFVYKELYGYVKCAGALSMGGGQDVVAGADQSSTAGTYVEATAERISILRTYVDAISNSEPFTTQAILNKVLDNHFYVGMGHFLGSAGTIIPFYRTLAGPPESFNALFQAALFPQASGSLANNIWAEMLSSGGWPLFAVFMIFFVLVLAVGSYLLRARDPIIVGGSALIFSYWAFYIHRNDLLFQIPTERRILFFWAVCVVLSMVGYKVASYVKRKGASSRL